MLNLKATQTAAVDTSLSSTYGALPLDNIPSNLNRLQESKSCVSVMRTLRVSARVASTRLSQLRSRQQRDTKSPAGGDPKLRRMLGSGLVGLVGSALVVNA